MKSQPTVGDGNVAPGVEVRWTPRPCVSLQDDRLPSRLFGGTLVKLSPSRSRESRRRHVRKLDTPCPCARALGESICV